jgi:hypothetical protein
VIVAPPAPPPIVPRFVSDVIVPPFDTPAPPAPPTAKVVMPAPPAPPLIVALVALVNEPIVAPLAFDTPAPPTPPRLPAAPLPPLIAPRLVRVVIVRLFDTPTPPVPEPAPAPPSIDPWFVSSETEQDEALTPVGRPLMIPLLRTSIEPPVLEIGPETVVEIVWSRSLQAARAAPGSPSAASAKAEAPASSVAREFLNVGGKNPEEADEFAALAKTETLVALLNIEPLPARRSEIP